MTVQLDGRRMTTRDNAHAHLAQRLRFPDWYGRNLDALYDLLTAGVGVEVICLTESAVMLEALGAYGRRLLQTMQEAADNGGPAVTVEE